MQIAGGSPDGCDVSDPFEGIVVRDAVDLADVVNK